MPVVQCCIIRILSNAQRLLLINHMFPLHFLQAVRDEPMPMEVTTATHANKAEADGKRLPAYSLTCLPIHALQIYARPFFVCLPLPITISNYHIGYC